MSLKLLELVKDALAQDKEIVVSRTKLQTETCKGFTQPYMESLGLTKVDLKLLERKGLAARGYAKTPKGLRVVWVLIGDENAN